MTLFVVFDTSALFYSDSSIVSQYSGEVNVQNSTVMVCVPNYDIKNQHKLQESQKIQNIFV